MTNGRENSAAAAAAQPACCPDCGRRVEVDTGLCPACLAGLFFSGEEAAPLAMDEPVREAGDMVGCYRLVEPVGEGGFAIVYRAEQEQPIRRQVALKLLKPGVDSRMVTARFEAERQALAMLEHPHIARVLDAGTTPDGRPFFVMDLVEGLPVTLFCESQRLGLEERLRLFLDVCSGIEHAHAKGVIHRDLKPSNVLAARGGEGGQARATIIDFGIAKALWQELTTRTLYTSPRLMLGTPQYMSPEQALHGGLDVDTRADVYSLGALLYEMLTARPPLEGAKTAAPGLEEWLRRIREQVPARPSRALSATLAARQGRAAVVRRVENEFDWVVLKALEKERSRRYQTVRELAEDVRRFLDDEPVTARPPSLGYQARKFVKRRRLQVALAALALGMLFAVSLLGAMLAVRAERAEKETRAAFSLADATAAHEKARGDRYGEAVALLCRALRLHPENREAAHRLLTLLAGAPAGVLAGPALRFEDSASHGIFLPPDGSRILTAHPRRGALMLWDWSPERASLARALKAPGTLSAFALSADGRLAAVGCEGGEGFEARAWSLESGEPAGPPIVPGSLASAAGALPHPGCTALAFSPDGGTLHTASTDQKIRAWRLADAALLWEAACAGVPHSLDASADGLRVAAAVDARLLLLDAADGRVVSDAIVQRHRVAGVRFTRDGKKVLATGGDTFAPALDALTGQRHGDLQHFERLLVLALSPREERAATGGEDGHVRLRTLKGVHLGAARLPQAVCALEFSPDGRQLAAGSQDSGPLVAVLDAGTGRELGPPLQMQTPALGFSFHPDGWRLLVTRHVEEAAVFDTRPRQMRPRVLDAGRPVVHAGFLPSGAPFVLTAEGGLLRWVPGGGDEPVEWFSCGVRPAAHVFRKKLALVAAGGSLRLLDLEAGGVRHELELPAPAGAVYLTPQGRHFLVMDEKSAGFTLHESAGGRPLHDWRSTAGPLTAMTCGEDGTRVFTAHGGGRVLFHDLRAGSVREASALEGGQVLQLQLSPDESRLLGSSTDPLLRLWDTASAMPAAGEQPPRHPGNGGWGGIRALFSRNTEEFFSFNAWDSRVRAFHSRNGAPSGPSLAHAGTVTHAAQSPGGSLLLTAEHEGRLSLWHLDRNLPAAAEMRFPSPVAALAFSADGLLALAAGADGVLHLWPLPPEQPGPLPEVFLRFAEGFGRWHLTPENVLQETSFEAFDAARRELLALPDARGDALRAWMKWLASDPDQRPAWPEG